MSDELLVIDEGHFTTPDPITVADVERATAARGARPRWPGSGYQHPASKGHATTRASGTLRKRVARRRARKGYK